MQHIGYSLVDASGQEVQFWGDSMQMCAGLPSFIRLPNGDDVHGVNDVGPVQDWRVVRRMGAYGGVAGVKFDGTNFIVTFAITPEMVVMERERRLAAGFPFAFDGDRGEHMIGTTTADMVGWNAVGTLAQAAINLGQPTTKITIVTNTGAAAITAMEWQQIIVAAGAFQQPIWSASFRLQSMSPIPVDFADDKYWR